MKTILTNIIFCFVLLFASISCNKSNEECMEVIDAECICTDQYTPVCGCNGKTYDNACRAYCSGIDEYAQGECE